MTLPLPSDPLEAGARIGRACEERAVPYAIGGALAYGLLSAEAIAVFKMLFFRAKDIVDLQRLIAVQAGRLNRAYVRDWLVRMMGDDDERVRKWDELTGG